MLNLENTSFFHFLQSLFHLVGGALRLDPLAYRSVFDISNDPNHLVFWIVLVAGISRMLGQSVVLFANRVQPARFIISLVWGALKFLMDVLIFVTVVWAIANLIGERSWNFIQVARGIALAITPYWFGLLILIPYLGMIFERFLRIYVFLALIVAVQAIFDLNFWNALWACALTLGVFEVFNLLLGRMLTSLNQRINRMVLGEKDVVLQNTRQIYDYFAQRDQLISK